MRQSHASQVLLSLLCICAFASDGNASYPAPRWSFKKLTPNGKYIFIMIGEAERSAIGGFLEPSEAMEIRLKYPQCGLYPNDDSIVPLWTIEGMWYSHDLQLTSDGVHMIFVSQIAKASSEVGLVFYENGKIIRSYRIEELVDDWDKCEVVRNTNRNTQPTVCWIEKQQLDDEKLEYLLITKEGNQFLFDVTKGTVISKSSVTRKNWTICATAFCAILIGLVFYIRWFNRRRRKPIQ